MTMFLHENVRFASGGFNRRRFLQYVSAGSIAAGALGFRDLMGLQADALRKQGRSMILLWMAGGPSQIETFDPKPGAENGGPTTGIDTSVSGIQIAQAWPKTAQAMKELALIRSMTNKEGNHQRASYQLHTGYLPTGTVKHPILGASLAKQVANVNLELPAVVSIGRGELGAGFLGVDYEPLTVTEPGDMPANVEPTIAGSRYQRRLGLLGRLEGDFAARGAKAAVDSHRRVYDKATRLVNSPNIKVFDISDEPESLRKQYGDSDFGRGCLLARRLVEKGVTFVEVVSRGWDTHDNNFERTTTLANSVDPAMATLIADLKERGRLDSTLVVWMGEFGRTPKINAKTGRDHFPKAFNVALAGGGVRGGQVIGKTAADGMQVEDVARLRGRPVLLDLPRV